MKLGRNEPCSCGSGKKYKKCCLNKPVFSQISKPELKKIEVDFEQHLMREMAQKQALEQIGIYSNYVRPVLFKGAKVWALGSTIYHSRPVNETFHEFIIFILRLTLGKEWWDQEVAKPEDKRHYITKCFFKFWDWSVKNSTEQNKVGKIWVAKPDGWSRSLISLAFDIASLIHNQKLPDHLLKRLRNMNEFQGARYEISVAAIFSRLGFDINFLDDTLQVEKHCEFIGKHQQTGTEIAVEAKSKHRQGVLNFEGIPNESAQADGKIRRLLNGAFQKKPGERPYLIFVDVNARVTPSVEIKDKKWISDIESIATTFPEYSEKNLSTHNAIIYTNYSYHYFEENEAAAPEFLMELSRYPKHPFKTEITDILFKALGNYGNVPNLDIDFSLG